MSNFRKDGNALVWQSQYDLLRIEPWGKDSLRVRATQRPEIVEGHSSLLPPQAVKAQVVITDSGASVANGRIRAEIRNDGHIRYLSTRTGEPLLEETPMHGLLLPPPRGFKSVPGSDLSHIDARFVAYDDEKIYGMGQHRHGLLDQKGCVLDLCQRNCEVNIPFMVSSRGYGLLWNNPALGRVEFAANGTHWVAEQSRQLDYWITAGDSYAAIMERYADATGHAPVLPEYASGFWQCKLRYARQDELLAVAREHKRRGLPMSIIVIDFFHWTLQGDFKFDPECWPDVPGMVKELEEMGIKVMVSVWPTVNGQSENFREMSDKGYLLRTERGVPAHREFGDNKPKGYMYVHFYDPTNPDARRYVWNKVRENYVRQGVKLWWVDACEPEIVPFDYDNMRYHVGPGLEVGCLYPIAHQQGFYEGMKAAGEKDVLMLCRSGFAGSQRYGAAIWSGDIESKFEVLRDQVRAGLNIGLSGIPWWTTDIGGFHSGDVRTAYFRELIVRWFQYGAFCPLFRLHGHRQPETHTPYYTGAANEVWTFGEEAYEIIKDLMFLRERLRPYIMKQMRLAAAKGTPPMRPLFFDFAQQDPQTYGIEDQFLLGPDLLVAPVLEEGARKREVYLPAGETWTDAWTAKKLKGGQWITADAPLSKIPLYIRGDAKLPIRVKN